MKNIELIILSFNDWGKPWTFYDFIINNNSLSEEESILFKELWIKASNLKLWDYKDLKQGSQKSQQYIKDNYPLSDEVAILISRAISYGWR